ncbi:MAG: phosphate signaling complex protein PhoU [Rhizobiaceae bacterium]
MDTSHIVSSFDEELSQAESLFLEMGGLVEAQIAEAAEALAKRDTELAEKVRIRDREVDALEYKIDELAVQVLALRQPVAEDLRVIVSTLKVSANLERMGDYAKNVAKRTTVLAKSPAVGSSADTIKRMSRLVREMLSSVLDAYVARDLQAADDVRRRDEEVDQIHNALFREILTYMMEDPKSITSCMHLLFIAKNIERIGDHVTSIAEQVHYLVSGDLPEDERPKSDVTSYITEDANPDVARAN